jgi:hypothetical protein
VVAYVMHLECQHGQILRWSTRLRGYVPVDRQGHKDQGCVPTIMIKDGRRQAIRKRPACVTCGE